MDNGQNKWLYSLIDRCIEGIDENIGPIELDLFDKPILSSSSRDSDIIYVLQASTNAVIE